MASTVKDRLWTTDGIRLVMKGPAFRRSGKKFSIAQPFVRIGRFAGIDIPIDDPEVSRWHLYLQRMPEGIFFVDLGSRTGLVYRGKPCAHGWLTAGEPLQLADYTLEIAEGTDSPSEPLARTEDDQDSLLPVTLTFQTEDGRATNHPLTRRLTLLGRSAPSNLRLSDPTIAKAHLGIYRTETDAWVVNLVGASAFQDGQPFVAVHLRDQDRLQLGSFQILSHLGPGALALDLDGRPESGDSILTADFLAARGHSSALPEDRRHPTDDSEVALDFGETTLADDSDRDLEDAKRPAAEVTKVASSVDFDVENLPQVLELRDEVSQLREEIDRLGALSRQADERQRQANAEHTRLQAENQTLHSRIESIGSELTQKQEESQGWQARLAELDQLQQEAGSLRAAAMERDALFQQVQGLKQELQSLRDQTLPDHHEREPIAAEERETLLQRIQGLEHELQSLREHAPSPEPDAERERLAAEVERLTASLSAAASAATESQRNEGELHQQLDAERESCQRAAAELESVRQQLAMADQQRESFSERLAALESVTSERDQLQAQVQELLEKLVTAEAEKLATETNAQENVLGLEQQWEEERQRLLTEWEAKLAALREESEQTRAELSQSAEERVRSLEQEFAAEKEHLIRDWEERLARASADDETRKKEVEEQFAERDRNISRMKQNQLKATELITERNRQLAELKARCDSLEGERSQLLIRTGELSQRLEAHASTDQSNAGLLASQTATIGALETQLRTAQEESSRLRRQVEELQTAGPRPEDAASRASEARIAELERIVNDKVRRSELEHQRLLDELAASQSDLAAMSKEVQSLTELLRHSDVPLPGAATRFAEAPRRPPESVPPPAVPREGAAATDTAGPKDEGEGAGRAHSKVAATLLNRAETFEQRRQMMLSLGWVFVSFVALITLCIAVVYWLL